MKFNLLIRFLTCLAKNANAIRRAYRIAETYGMFMLESIVISVSLNNV